MIAVHCSLCKKELDDPGALIIGIPDDDSWALKSHVCAWCYHHMLLPCISQLRKLYEHQALETR